jgi:hypothetical protein
LYAGLPERIERLVFAHKIFADKTFRYREEGDQNWKLSQPLYDAVMVALDRLWLSKDNVIAKKTAVVRAVTRLFDDEDAYAILVGRPNTAKAIRDRIDLLADTVKRATRL